MWQDGTLTLAGGRVALVMTEPERFVAVPIDAERAEQHRIAPTWSLQVDGVMIREESTDTPLDLMAAAILAGIV